MGPNENDGGICWPADRCQVNPIYMAHDRSYDPIGCSRHGVVKIKKRGYCRQHARRVFGYVAWEDKG